MSSPKSQFEFLTHDSCSFYNDIARYSSYGGVVLEEEEGERLAVALGQRKAAILQNHGLL